MQADLKPLLKSPVQSSEVIVQKIQELPHKQHQHQPELPKEEEKSQTVANQNAQGMSPAVITALLLVPLVAVIVVAVFIRWRKSHMYRGNSAVYSHVLLCVGLFPLISFF